jgi:hypothetical protein
MDNSSEAILGLKPVTLLDYVTRRFNASSARAEEVRGAGPSVIAALRDFQIQLEP